MNRNHIHFSIGKPGENEVISGMRYSSEILIYIDVERAMKDGIVFQLSSNNVILSKGIDNILGTNYFKKVELIAKNKNNKVLINEKINKLILIEFGSNFKSDYSVDEIIEIRFIFIKTGDASSKGPLGKTIKTEGKINNNTLKFLGRYYHEFDNAKPLNEVLHELDDLLYKNK